jgi:hypothetical protein
MTREGEIGMKSSAPGDNRGSGTLFTACIVRRDGDQYSDKEKPIEANELAMGRTQGTIQHIRGQFR